MESDGVVIPAAAIRLSDIQGRAFAVTFEHLPCATFSTPQNLVTQKAGVKSFGLGLLRCRAQTPEEARAIAGS